MTLFLYDKISVNIMKNMSEDGFTIAEVVVGIIVFSIVAVACWQTIVIMRRNYAQTRQMNDVAAAMLTFPELNRGLRYESINNATFTPDIPIRSEGQSGSSITYKPTVTIQDSSSVSETSTVPNSKVIDVSIPYRGMGGNVQPIKLRLLIARNGIGQQ